MWDQFWAALGVTTCCEPADETSTHWRGPPYCWSSSTHMQPQPHPHACLKEGGTIPRMRPPTKHSPTRTLASKKEMPTKQSAPRSACCSSVAANRPGSSLQCMRPLAWCTMWYPSLYDIWLSLTPAVPKKCGLTSDATVQGLLQMQPCRPAAAQTGRWHAAPAHTVMPSASSRTLRQTFQNTQTTTLPHPRSCKSGSTTRVGWQGR